jgi:oxygen-independent coproporphyrinogen-3 oxidase
VHPDSIGLYVHIPFCTAKCGYCDFNSYAGQEHLVPPYTGALLREAALWQKTVAGRPVETVFFGGGTPSLTPLDEMEQILSGLRCVFAFAGDVEVSLEANPGRISREHLAGLRALGVNRLSIGVQSFDDDELLSLDRIHSSGDATEAFRLARTAGFDNVNLDLIFGLPGQPLARWQRSLERALALAPEHLSLYALTVEDGTPLARQVARGKTPAPDPDMQAEHYEWTQDRLAAAGYEQYEISNWARPGRACRHNLVYWENRQYLGLGAGAHSHLDGKRFSNVLLPDRYIELVDASAVADGEGRRAMRHVAGAEQVTHELAMADTMILGLRLNAGIDRSAFRARHGCDLDQIYGDVLSEFAGYGIAEPTATHVRLTRRGRLLSNELFQRLLPQPAGSSRVGAARPAGR